jgi:hypothetical protein
MPFDIGGYIYNSSLADTQDYKNIITRGLILHLDASALESYPSSGTSWFDISGNGNNGTLTNGPTYSTNAIRLDGSNDYITLPTTGFAPPTNTTEFWIKCHEYKGAHFFVIDASDNPELRLSINGSKVVVQWYDDGTYIATFNSSANISLDVWYNISFTTQNNDFRLYINGILDTADTSGTYTGGVSSNAGEHTLGTYNRPAAGYNGYANVSYGAYRFYKRVLSPTEILHNYNIQKGRFGL